MTSVLFKMADINVGYLKVKNVFNKALTPKKYARKRIEHAFEERIDNSVPRVTFDITRQSLVIPSSDPPDRIVYPIHKLMIDSYNIQKCPLKPIMLHPVHNILEPCHNSQGNFLLYFQLGFKGVNKKAFLQDYF